MGKTYKLMNGARDIYTSDVPGELGGYAKLKIYGRLDCASANAYITKGMYVKHRVFFKDEATAIAAGFRPCARCLKDKYCIWKASGKSLF